VWIEDFRRTHGLELDEFARIVNRHREKRGQAINGVVSDTLIHILECSKDAVTHPVLANAIAEVCGATAEQRDMIVTKEHRGEWTPPKRKGGTPVFRPKRKAPNNGSRAVVKIDRYGNTVGWFESVKNAGMREQLGEGAIRDRCKRRMEYDITPNCPYTYRYAGEWTGMTGEDKLKDIRIME